MFYAARYARMIFIDKGDICRRSRAQIDWVSGRDQRQQDEDMLRSCSERDRCTDGDLGVDHKPVRHSDGDIEQRMVSAGSLGFL